MRNFLKNSRTILGMNARNLEFIRPNNLKKSKKIADNKLLSKKLLDSGGMPVPHLIAKVSSYDSLSQFDWETLPNSFVLKPNMGFGGGGILVVYAKKKNRNDAWIKADGSIVTIEDIKAHIQNILEGSFSLSSTPDVAFFEERLKLHKTFKPYTYKGVPDIRIIVFNKVPVMAMLRLPTKESDGKANLQLGGIGVGIDLASGVTTTAVYGKQAKTIEYIPGTKLLLSGIKIPYWNDILSLCVRAQACSGLGYLGADIAIDRERGPVFLELNARPGLSIQIANQAGLKERLERVKGLKIKSSERGIRVGMNLFGGEVEEEVEGISGKKVIGSSETIQLIGKNGKSVTVEAKIDTGADSTSIDSEVAKQLGFEHVLIEFDQKVNGRNIIEETTRQEREKIFLEIKDLADTILVKSSHGSSYRPMIRVEIEMDGIRIPAKVSVIRRKHMRYPVIIGKKNLRKFLVDINKR